MDFNFAKKSLKHCRRNLNNLSFFCTSEPQSCLSLFFPHYVTGRPQSGLLPSVHLLVSLWAACPGTEVQARKKTFLHSMFVFLTRGVQVGRQACGHMDRTERGFVAARLARGQGRISFQACTNYQFKLWSPALSSLILKSVTPSHKTIKGLRGLAKGARKWSQLQG